ncbi:hypothetical protein ACS0TY_028641 [Phlomoides rotata]
MDGIGNVGCMESDKGKVTRGRRSWTRVEEEALVQCLTTIVNEGWKADNGFKAGFQRELEKGMRKILPGTDICATPHINSKIHVWKKEYGLLTDLLSKSGIGWNSTTYTLDINDEAMWDAQKRVDPGVKAMRAKSWPYYESWLDIFGKDRATGEHAVDPIDIVNEMLQRTVEQEGETGVKAGAVNTDDHEVDENTSVAQPSQIGLKNLAKGKKRKIMDQSMSAFVETIGEYMKGSDETFNTHAQRMGCEYDAKIARTTLNDVMKLIPWLSMRDKLKVSDELVQNTKRLEYFLSLPQDEQAAYVEMLLDGSI